MLFTEDYKKIPSDIYGDSFVGMNSGHGFTGVYNSIINENELKRLYVIKGAAGTGKSTLMKKLAKRAVSSDIPVQRFACSSDPDSLDCVIVNSSIAVLDGTMPHPCELEYPGAVSELIDITKFWNNDLLVTYREDIENYSDSKKNLFSEAYRNLSSMEILAKERYMTISKAINFEKMTAVIERFIKGIEKSLTSGKSNLKIHRGIGMKGKFRIDTQERISDTVIQVSDVYGSSYVFMKNLAITLSKVGRAYEFSVDPITPELICDIYLPDSKILVTIEQVESPDRIINMQRFIYPEKLSEYRGGLRLSKKCSSIISDEVLKLLEQAGDYHFKLEDIYSNAMDFNALSEYTDFKISEIINLCSVF